jgi:hypothetical protein
MLTLVGDKEGWLVAFADELRRLRPHLSLKFAWTVSLQHYQADIDPARAARAYHDHQRKTDPSPPAATQAKSKRRER